MSCGCDNKKIMCEYAHVSELARKAANWNSASMQCIKDGMVRMASIRQIVR